MQHVTICTYTAKAQTIDFVQSESGEEEKLSSIYVLRRNIHEAVSAAIKISTVARVLVARCSNAVGGITQYRLETRSY